ncbi:MAG: pyruvate formate-lyase-activating protein [Oligoflexia bacterium]|nr:pyruvate formate-lyase-activating protein [Oligoflexia bacterium]
MGTRPEERAAKGRLHSIETCGTVDGPGVRFVVFLQGCALRCLYCHNPDSRDPRGGRPVTPEELLAQANKYRSFMAKSGGGVTVTGGEPLLQPEFVARFLNLCKAEGLHTALDTSGFCELERAKPALEAADLVLLDIKSMDAETHRRVTGVPRDSTLAIARYLHEIGKRTWIRFVLVPGLTDAPANVTALAEFVSGFNNIEKVQLLPFHKMGEKKWEKLGLRYELGSTRPPSPIELERAAAAFRSRGVIVE